MSRDLMRILFLWPNRLRRDMGGPKIVVEVAEAMAGLGWETTLYDPWTLPDGTDSSVPWQDRCRNYLKAHAYEFDVIDYDHGHLPFPRTDFCPNTLMVARSGLLSHHFLRISVPDLHPFRDPLRRLVRGKGPHERYAENHRLAHMTCDQADLVNVANEDDKKELVACGLSDKKIAVFPFGLSEDRRRLFAGISVDPPGTMKVAFVGTFDGRKGAREFPAIVRGIIDRLPGARVCLMGTKGRFQTAEDVRAYFPASAREHLEVVPEYPPGDLPRMLANCSVGIFPSYIEGFPFGVLEMLSAALPVAAYDAPGAPMMVPTEWLVPRGNASALVSKVVDWLTSPENLKRAREEARRRSEVFTWSETAEKSSATYLERLHGLRNGEA